MKIILTVNKAPTSSPLTGQVLILGDGASLGRAAGNHVKLVDDNREISSKHAAIKLVGSNFALVDLSTNGTFLNKESEAIGKGNERPLQSGDIICVGEYQFSVEIDAAEAQADLPEGLESVGFLDNTASTPGDGAPGLTPTPAPATPASVAPAAASGGIDDFDQWLDPAASSAPADPWGADSGGTMAGAGLTSGLEEEPTTDPLAAIDKAAGSGLQGGASLGAGLGDDDDDWWQTSADNAPANQMAMPAVNVVPEPQPVPKPTAPQAAVSPLPAATPATAATSATISAQMAELLGLRGLTPAQQAALLPGSAAIVRSAVDNLVNLLKARASIKNELRASRTLIETEGNNPLKFSAGSGDALQAMFANNSDAFLSPEQAVEEGFEDIADHQIAVLCAMKLAFNEMLSQFNPSELELTFGAEGKGVLGRGKGKSWERYCTHYEKLQRDPEASYNELFGETFAQTYEAKLTELRMSRRLTRNS